VRLQIKSGNTRKVNKWASMSYKVNLFGCLVTKFHCYKNNIRKEWKGAGGVVTEKKKRVLWKSPSLGCENSSIPKGYFAVTPRCIWAWPTIWPPSSKMENCMIFQKSAFQLNSTLSTLISGTLKPKLFFLSVLLSKISRLWFA